MLFNAALILFTVAAIVLATAVLLTQPRKHVNQLFFVLSLGIAAWILANVLSLTVDTPDLGLFVTRFITPTSIVTLAAFVSFVIAFPRPATFVPKFVPKLMVVLTSIVVLLSFTDLNVSLAEPGADDMYQLGALYVPYLLLIVGYIISVLYILFRKRRELTGRMRLQINYVLAGLGLTAVPAVITGAILPALGYEALWDYSPFFSIFLIGFTATAIVRHRLFDIRLAIARSLTYILVLGTLAAVYSLLVFGLFGMIFADSPESVSRTFDVLVVLFLAFTFQPLRRYFDRFTRRLFFHDAYRLRETLDHLGGVLAAETKLQPTLGKSLAVLADVLKPTSAHLIALEGEKVYRSTLSGEARPRPKASELMKLLDPHEVLTVADQLPEGELKDFLRPHTAVVVRLQTHAQTTGLLLLGPKRSGDIYNSLDLTLLSISSHNLALAIDNAKKFERIAGFNVTLKKEVAQATASLRSANRKLQALDKTKDEFISMTSHQLRPQVTASRGFVSLLKEGSKGPLNREQAELTELTDASLRRINAITTDMLNLSHIRKGALVVTKTKNDIGRIIAEEVERQRPVAKRLSIDMHFEAPSTKLTAACDAAKIREVVTNFIDNALHYSKPKTSIEIELEHSHKQIRFVVIDHGIGVPKRDQARIFQEFFRAKNARELRPNGTGLGLFYAQKVIDAHGGAVIFKSREGKGSTFGFTLPV